MRQLNALMERAAMRQRQDDLRTARICALLANINRDRKKRPQPFTELDFMPGRRPEQTVEEQLAIVEVLNTVFGGVDIRPKEVNDGAQTG